MSRVLIKGGCVISLSSRTGNHHEADVLLDGAVIAEVGPDIRARDAEVIDGSNTIVMPGFVDAHRHVAESLFRASGELSGVPLARYTPDDVYAATLVGLLGAVEAGITTVVDWSELPVGEHTEAALQAHADSGVRTVFVHGHSAKWDEGMRRLERKPGPLIDYAAGPPEPQSRDGVAADWALARELGLRIHTHAGISAAPGTLASLSASGLLRDDVTLIHCSNFDDGDLDAVNVAGASVVLTPSSEMAAGLQPIQLQRLIDRNIRPGLGVDTEMTAPGDLFAQMRAAISMQHATLFDLKLAGKGGIPRLLTTREVIRYATVDAARSIGRAGVIGALEPGMQADLIMLRTDRPNIWPINDPIGAVVWGMDTSNVDWVFVAGRPLLVAGEPQTDLDRARDLAGTARQRVAAAAGTLASSGAGE